MVRGCVDVRDVCICVWGPCQAMCECVRKSGPSPLPNL
jgi:hypothetical protein